MLKSSLLALFICLTSLSGADAATLTIAAASDMVYCLPELVQWFQKSVPGERIQTVFGASGSLSAQISHGAPYDVLMSADLRYPQELIQTGAAVEASLVRYARGHLVLWTNNPNISFERGMADLAQAGVRRIALANPETAPYGRAAKIALQQTQRWDSDPSRWVFGENIAQTMQYAETGHAEIAFLSRSLVFSSKMAGKGRFQTIPDALYPPIDQALVVTRVGAGKPLAAQFAAFMQTGEARRILQRNGFSIPDQRDN